MSLLTAILILTVSSLPCHDPNEACLNALVSNWLKTNPVVNRTVYVQGEPNDPNNKEYCKYTIKQWRFNPLRIMDLNQKPDGVVNLKDFAVLSACWSGKIQDANAPPEPNSTVPICFRVKDCKACKCHLDLECWRLAGKEIEIIDCDPNNVCLNCLARKAQE